MKKLLLRYFIAIFLGLFLVLSLYRIFRKNPTTPADLLLKDYSPVNIYNVPRAKILKGKYKIVDMHSHDYFAESPAQIKQWVKTMDELRIERTILLTYSHGAKFDSLMKVYSKYPGKFELWCGFDYTSYDKPGFGPGAIKELERCYKLGAKGVGELGDKGKGLFYCTPRAFGMHIDDPRMDPLLEKCGELGMPINIHIGDPVWMYLQMDSTNDGLMNAFDWREDNQKGILNLNQMLVTLQNAVKKHPNTIFIACHLANFEHDLQKLGKLLDKYPNLYTDIAGRFGEFAPVPRYTRAFFEKYQDRIFYGTDMGFDKQRYLITFRILETNDEHFYYHPFNYHWALYGLGLDTVTLKKIYYQNSERLYKLLEEKRIQK